VLTLLVLLFLAVLAGRQLLRPESHPAHRVAAVETATPEYTPESELAATPEPTTEPGETETPASLPSPAESPAATASPIESPSVNPSGARLALIVDDCGQWIDTERGFIALGIPLTMSVLPSVPYTGRIAREASDAGKGVMLHLPMETLSGLNPGPGKVTTAMTDDQIDAQVRADLDQVPLARGINNHEGSKASADSRVMRDVIGVLAHRGDLFFVDSRTNAASVGEQTAQAMGVPTAARDVFLDNRADVSYSEAQLLEAAAIAKRTGSAIAIGHPRPTTLAAVRAMIPRLEASGVQFVLVQDLVATDPR
jgi:polysaccharide deacetylase 2 family uncharacterized protein YibQ